MAESVRGRQPLIRGAETARSRAVAAVVGLCWLASACGERPPPTPADPAEHLAVILEHCHGPLRGTLGSAHLELRDTVDGPATQVTVAFPDRLRLKRPDGPVELLTEAGSWQWSNDAQTATPLDEARRAELEHLRACLRAVLLLPLYGAEQVTRRGTGLELRAGEEAWQLDVGEDPRTPQRLRGDGVDVRFVTLLDTGYTRLPQETVIGRLGTRYVEIRDSRLVLEEDVFRPPGERAKPKLSVTMPNRRTDLPQTPEIQDLPARRFLVFDDPGDWPGRGALLGREGRALHAQEQTADGLPVYTELDGRACVLIPFRPRDGAPAFEPGPQQRVLEVAAHRAGVFAPPRGTWDSALRDAREHLGQFLASKAERTDGTIWVTAFPDRGLVPGADTVDRLKLRFEMPLLPR